MKSSCAQMSPLPHRCARNPANKHHSALEFLLQRDQHVDVGESRSRLLFAIPALKKLIKRDGREAKNADMLFEFRVTQHPADVSVRTHLDVSYN